MRTLFNIALLNLKNRLTLALFQGFSSLKRFTTVCAKPDGVSYDCYSYTVYFCIMYAYLWVYLCGKFHTSCCGRPDAKFTLGPAESCSYVWYLVSKGEIYIHKISPGHTIQLRRIQWHRSVPNPMNYISVVMLARIYIYRWVQFTWKLCQALRCVEVCKCSGIQVALAPKSIRLTIFALGLKFLKPPGVIYMVLVHGVQLLCRLQAKVACDKHDSHLFSGKKGEEIPFFYICSRRRGGRPSDATNWARLLQLRSEQTLPASFLLRHWSVQKAACPTW